MIPKTKKLFISYRSSDAPKVDKIAKDLRLLKYDDGTPRYTTWQDKHDLPPASPNWWDAIVEAISDCDVFVFHLSKDSLQSEVCRAELEYAYKRNRPIIPVVLDDEFDLVAQSGKYNLLEETWPLVPDWLRDVQFLFYIETRFYSWFQEAVAVFERNWPRDIPAPRPRNPDSKAVHGSSHALYSAARDYAERLAFADAEKHFSTLIRRNDEDYADLATQWLNLIRGYAELIEIVEHRSPPTVFNRRWTMYQTLFPNDLVEGIFDPRGLGQRKVVTPAKPTSISLMPKPFAWIEIPGGRGMMKTDNSDVTLTIPTESYWMSKYPITNAQYAKFIDAGSYSESKWWTDAGWEAREKDKWTQPRYWKDATWNRAEQPVVGISWHESVAFCQWLSDVSDEKIMLPTEEQWQYAAQGDDGRDYPWGNEWDGNRCNNNEDRKGICRTTPVRQYENKGDSPFGVVDMAGNVWEWCLTDYETKSNDLKSNAMNRVLRGGSWNYNNSDFFRCVFRFRLFPSLWFNYLGFRVSRS